MAVKELNDNWEKNYIGYPLTGSLKRKLMAEHQARMRRETDRRIFESVVVSVLDRRKRITGVGLNVPGDLILNNFGTWLAGLIRNPSNSNSYVNLIDVNNASQSVYTFGTCVAGSVCFNTAVNSPGTYIQVGSGSTAAARANYKIETAFGTAPESAVFGSGAGSYAAGVINFSAAITAGGSGTVTETGLFAQWALASTGISTFMLFHDILASGVPFTAAQLINVAYSITL